MAELISSQKETPVCIFKATRFLLKSVISLSSPDRHVIVHCRKIECDNSQIRISASFKKYEHRKNLRDRMGFLSHCQVISYI